MKICTPEGRTAVLKERYLHLAPDPETMESKTLVLDSSVSLEDRGAVAKHVIYEINRQNARVDLSKSGDSNSPLIHVVLTTAESGQTGSRVELYVDQAALACFRELITDPEPAAETRVDPASKIDIEKHSEEASASALNLDKPQAKSTSESQEASDSKQTAQNRSHYHSRNSGSDGSLHKAVVFLVAGMMLIGIPGVFDVILDGAFGAGSSPVANAGPNTIAGLAGEVGEEVEALRGMIELMFTMLGIGLSTMGMFRLYKGVSGQ